MTKPSNGEGHFGGSLPQELPIVGRSYRLGRLVSPPTGWDHVVVVAVEAGESGVIVRYRIPNGAILARTLASWTRCGLVEVRA